MLNHVDPNILQITNAFMYTEYPHKSFWSTSVGDKDYRSALLELLTNEPTTPLLLYVHILYCTELCWFCTCHIGEITKDQNKRKNYLGMLYSEIRLLREFFNQHSLTPNFTEIHLGGGSPTDLTIPDFDCLVENLGSIVNMENLSEFSIEIDPRHTTREMLRYYHDKGINRISMGIQDFDPKVQGAINRVQPIKLVEDLMSNETDDLFSNGVNFDIICGLPHQTKETIRRTAAECVRLSPDRICLNYLHLAPHFTKHQSLMSDGKHGRPDRLPDYYERKELFAVALETLTQGGYVRTGYDHFAKPTDSVARAMADGKMHWNALGVTAGRYDSILSVGVHSYSTLGNYYFQNFYDVQKYQEALEQGLFPIFRGHKQNQDDLMRRDVIQTLRSFFSIGFEGIDAKYGINFENYFKEELASLDSYIKDELVEIKNRAIIVTEKGHQFTNTICYVFDAYKKSRPRF
ncbi:MAG: oxygen-independent coproporphyrinogen III oxidase [bacterium]|nr:oxygen-independent coproporphyrinogen III oxidase [bacterium]